MLEAREPSLLRYSWARRRGRRTEVAYRLEPRAGGTRFIFEHTGFTGVGGLFLAVLLGRVRPRCSPSGLPPVLNDMN